MQTNIHTYRIFKNKNNKNKDDDSLKFSQNRLKFHRGYPVILNNRGKLSEPVGTFKRHFEAVFLCVAQAGLKLMKICLPLPPKFWD